MTISTAPATIQFNDSYEGTGTLEFSSQTGTLTLWTDEGPEYIETDLISYGYVPEPGHIYIKDWDHTGLAPRMQEQGLVKIVDTVHVGPFNSLAYLVEVTI